MNAKPVIALLVILCLALGAALLYGLKKTRTEIQDLQLKLNDRSNNWVRATSDLAKVNNSKKELESSVSQLNLELQTAKQKADTLSQQIVKVQADAQAAEQAAKLDLAKREAKIKELESEKDDLAKRMTELNASIGSLEDQIKDTEDKLAASEGDRTFLLKELKRLQAEKAELERQFYNLAFLREQVKKLKDEMSIARRLEWIRRGIYGTTAKGAEKMAQTIMPTPGQTNFSLDVQLHQDGTVNPASTNAPENR